MKTKYFVYMAVSALLSIVLIIFDNLTECKRFHMKVQCAIYSGQIRMNDVAGVSLLEVPAIPLGRTLVSSSTIPTV